MILCYSKIWKIKHFLDPPKRLKDTNGRDMSTRTSVCQCNQPVTWILNSLSDSDYKVIPSLKIIIVFSCPHFSIYDIFYILENIRSFNERATHFKTEKRRESVHSLISIPSAPPRAVRLREY